MPPPTQTCGDWHEYESCPEGYTYAGMDGNTCDAFGYNCPATCCKRKPVYQTCGQWGTKNTCGINYAYVGPDYWICNYDGANCRCVRDSF